MDMSQQNNIEFKIGDKVSKKSKRPFVAAVVAETKNN